MVVKEKGDKLCLGSSYNDRLKNATGHWTSVRLKYLNLEKYLCCMLNFALMRVITEPEIKSYLSEKKLLPVNFENPPDLFSKGIYARFDEEIRGESGNTFKLIIRQSKFNTFDFSIILGVMIGGELFRLKRYNGKHIHSNKIEKETISGFHIHTATERYQKNGWKEEDYAILAQSYYDWKTALTVCLNENNFVFPIEIGQRRLNGN